MISKVRNSPRRPQIVPVPVPDTHSSPPPLVQKMHESPSTKPGGTARMSFPKFPGRNRKTIDVTLNEGQTVGELLCQYTGEFTEENIATVSRLNKNLEDLDFVQPGTVIRLVDNRRAKLATPEHEWWDNRGLGNGEFEMGNSGDCKNEGKIARSAAGAVLNVADGKENEKENTPKVAVERPKTLKEQVNPNGVDMRVPEA